MIVCLCHRVSDRDIARAAAAGCPSFEALQDELLVGMACGACTEYAMQTFAELAPAVACGGCAGAARCGGAPLALRT